MTEMKTKMSKLDDEKDNLQEAYQRANRKIKSHEEQLETKKKEIEKFRLQTDQLRIKET
jgi:chromosome segregation ATPase